MPNKNNNSKNFAHIIGIGNLTRRDDGIAIRIIQELENYKLPKNTKLTDLGTGGIDIISALEDWEIGIIIDAIDLPNLKPGDIIVFPIRDENIPEVKGLSSTHGFDAITALKLAFNLNEYNLPGKIFIIGIQIKEMSGLGLDLSKEVEESIPKVIAKVKELLNKK